VTASTHLRAMHVWTEGALNRPTHAAPLLRTKSGRVNLGRKGDSEEGERRATLGTLDTKRERQAVWQDPAMGCRDFCERRRAGKWIPIYTWRKGKCIRDITNSLGRDTRASFQDLNDQCQARRRRRRTVIGRVRTGTLVPGHPIPVTQ